MELSLGKTEIGAFQALCTMQEECTVNKLAKELNRSKSFVSREAKSLADKGLIEIQRSGKKKILIISRGQHAVALRELMASNSHVPFTEVLSGSTIAVLTGLLYQPASVDTIARLTFTPKITVRRNLLRLLNLGVITRHQRKARSLTTESQSQRHCAHKHEYAVALHGLSEFIQKYAAFAVQTSRANITGSLFVRRTSGLIRTNANNIPNFMVQTGLSVFNKYGIGIVQTDFKDYYFNVLETLVKKLTLEEVLVHALVRTTVISSSREVSYVLLVIAKNRKKLNLNRFLEIAGDYGVESSAKQCIEFVDGVLSGKEIPKPLVDFGMRAEGLVFLDQNEFMELLKQYDV
ncbi:MAG: helix-turn-helix domain-containing protein [Candidatus Micrarchaeota archaeon]